MTGGAHLGLTGGSSTSLVMRGIAAEPRLEDRASGSLTQKCLSQDSCGGGPPGLGMGMHLPEFPSHTSLTDTISTFPPHQPSTKLLIHHCSSHRTHPPSHPLTPSTAIHLLPPTVHPSFLCSLRAPMDRLSGVVRGKVLEEFGLTSVGKGAEQVQSS